MDLDVGSGCPCVHLAEGGGRHGSHRAVRDGRCHDHLLSMSRERPLLPPLDQIECCSPPTWGIAPDPMPPIADGRPSARSRTARHGRASQRARRGCRCHRTLRFGVTPLRDLGGERVGEAGWGEERGGYGLERGEARRVEV